MRVGIGLIVTLGLISFGVCAEPFLVSDYQQADFKITNYDCDLNGTVETLVPDTKGNGDTRVRMDLAGIVSGQHRVKCRAVNLWGESAYSPDFIFSKSVPSVPGTLKLSLQ